jgi:hypothetical protein
MQNHQFLIGNRVFIAPLIYRLGFFLFSAFTYNFLLYITEFVETPQILIFGALFGLFPVYQFINSLYAKLILTDEKIVVRKLLFSWELFWKDIADWQFLPEHAGVWRSPTFVFTSHSGKKYRLGNLQYLGAYEHVDLIRKWIKMGVRKSKA